MSNTTMLVSSIIVSDSRQRQAAKADTALITSIERDGLLNPIIVHADGRLVAGERRLDAHRELKLTHIAVSILEDMAPDKAFRIELTENLARKQLSWQEECKAVADYHAMRMAALGPGLWNQRATSGDLGIGETTVSRNLLIAANLGDEEVAGCPTATGAYNLITKRAERALVAAESRGLAVAAATSKLAMPQLPIGATKAERTQALMNHVKLDKNIDEVLAANVDPVDIIAAGAAAKEALEQHRALEQQAADIVICADFLEWAETYAGPKFDVLHVDFPYGKGYKGSNTRRTGRAHVNPTYLDDPDIYFELVDGLMSLQDNVTFPAAHMIFWFDMQYYAWTVDRITAGGWTLVQPFPLIWTKGYTGVASDPRRRPRHCYETALLFSRGDRQIAKLENDHFACPLEDSKLHLNQKPVAMLKHFLTLVVDEHTALLDPTCGSGSALTAAMQMKAARVLGIELDASNAEVARHLLHRKAPEDQMQKGRDLGVENPQ